jgi:uncharacterized protein (TIGR03437 family)
MQVPPSFFSSPSVNQGSGWLSVSPSAGTFTQIDYDGTLYTYQATVIVSANPASSSAGSYSGSIDFTADGQTVSTVVTMNATAQPAQLTVGPASIGFTYQQGSGVLPESQALSVFTNPTGSTFSVTLAASGQSWLSVGGSATGTPAVLPLSINPGSLAPGNYATQVTVSSADGAPVNIPVTLTVLSAPAKLTVTSQQETFTLVQGSSPAIGQVTILNTGSGTLQFTSQAVSQGNWLALNGLASGSSTPSAPAVLGYTVSPAGLGPGVYTGQIIVQDIASANQATVTIVLAVSQASQALTISQSGLTFTAIQGTANPTAQSFMVNTQGSGATQFTAQAQMIPNPLATQPSWLGSTISAGTSTSSIVTVRVNQYGLPPGQYYGSIEIAAPNAVNSPQMVSVLLTVLPPTQTGSGVTFSTGGVLFTAAAGTQTPQQQQITLFNPTGSTVNYSSTTFSNAGGNWLTVSKPIGELLPGANVLTVQADFSVLAAGVVNGTASFAFGDGSVQSIQVAAVANAAAGTGIGTATGPISHAYSPGQKAVVGGCLGGVPAVLVSVFDEPTDRSLLQASVGQLVRVQAVDDCGKPLSITNGDSIQVVFGNNDTPLDLHDRGAGIWEGTWVPLHPAAQVSLSAIAARANTSLSSIGVALAEVVQSAPIGAAAQISGAVNAALGAKATPGVVTPGGYIAIYGSNLTAGNATSVSTTPLPTNLNGTQLLLGGQPLPIFYESGGQVNALVPQNVTPNTTYPLTIINGSTQSVPASLTVTGLQPGIYTADMSGSGQGIVEISGTTLLAAPTSSFSRPAQRGSEYVQVFCTGLGPVSGSNGEAPPADGVAAPATLVYHTTANVTALIGGVNAPVVFSGLTPTLVGLYQVNVQVPSGAPAGDAVPLVLTVTDPTSGRAVQSNSVTIALQ